MAIYKTSSEFTAPQKTAPRLGTEPFSGAQKTSLATLTQSTLAEMCETANCPHSTRLSVASHKPSVGESSLAGNMSFSVTAKTPAMIGTEQDNYPYYHLSMPQNKKATEASKPAPVAAVADNAAHSRLQMPQKKEILASVLPSRPKAEALLAQDGCSLTRCETRENCIAIFPQTEALSTVSAGQALSFGEALYFENNVVLHKPDDNVFLIKDAGIYELRFNLNYEVCAPCMLLIGFESLPQSWFRQQIETVPARGKLRATVRLLLDAGVALRLLLINDSDFHTAKSAIISNATFEIEQLHSLNVSCKDFMTATPSKNIHFENSFSTPALI